MKKIILFSLFVVFLAIPVKGVVFPPEDIHYLDGEAYLEVDFNSLEESLLLGLSGPMELACYDPYPWPSVGGQEAFDSNLSCFLDDIITESTDAGILDGLLDFPTPAPGKTTDTNPDPDESFPAESFFDIYFELTIIWPDIVLTVHNEEPLRIESMIDSIPPDLSSTPYIGVVPIPLFDEFDNYVGDLTYAEFTPEPTTLILLSLGGLALFRKRKK